MAKTEQKGPTHEEISRRAFEIFEKSGHAPGRDMDNWLAAEKQLKGASTQQARQQPGNSQQPRQQAQAQTLPQTPASFPKSQPQTQPAKGQTQAAQGATEATPGQPKQPAKAGARSPGRSTTMARI